MKKTKSILTLLTFLIISTPAWGGKMTIYSGTFTRVRGRPVKETARFSANEGPGTIHIARAGDREGKGRKAPVVFIRLNGEILFRHVKFHKKVREIEKDVYLEKNNLLEILLKGKPGGKIDIHITQSDMPVLTVLMDGTGSGRVTSSPGEIFCEKTCEETFGSGTMVTLTASPYSGNTFVGWSGGGCSTAGDCNLTIWGNTSVTAIFDKNGSNPLTLVTPYVNGSEMKEIRNIFNTLYHPPPWGQVHDGLDIYPAGDMKPFRAACQGRVQRVFPFDDFVYVNIQCDSTFSIEYTFEPQAPGSSGAQAANILVSEGDPVSQGQLIGYLLDANPGAAHVHFTLNRNAIPACPEPYFLWDDKISIQNLIAEAHGDTTICSGPVTFPPLLFTPYVNEFDMNEIRAGFSSEYSTSPWGFVHDGIDIYPKGNLKEFQAACSGTVDSLELKKSLDDGNWLVDLLIQCDDYVYDPMVGGYFIPFSTRYLFETKSPDKTDGDTQLSNIFVSTGQSVVQGDVIGMLNDAVPEKSHLHFGLVQYGNSFFTGMGVTGIPLCPEPHFSTAANASLLNLLHVYWPHTAICYQE